MFVRKHKIRGLTYLALVENVWNPVKKKYQQKRVTTLGKTTELDQAQQRVEAIVLALNKFCRQYRIPALSEGLVIEKLEDDERLLSRTYDWGVHLLSAWTLKRLGIIDSLKSLVKDKTGLKISLEKLTAVTRTLVAHRLKARSDASERSTHGWYKQELFVAQKEELNLMDFYRSLDVLIEHKDEIERDYYEHNRDLFTQGLDLVLFDTTSIYYWGWPGAADEKDLLQYGFSKDGKGNLKQVIVGVLMTSAGEPVAHEVFPGNMADVKAFARIMEVIKEKYQLKRVILIADRGMVSEQNLISLEQGKFEYIVGIRMRKLPKDLKKKLFQPVDPKHPYQDMEVVKRRQDGSVKLYSQEFPVSKFSKEEVKQYFTDKVIRNQLKSTTFNEGELIKQVKKRRLFVCVNPAVAQATKKKRKFFKKIIQNKINHTTTKEWIIKNGYKKYLKFEKGLEPKLDTDKLEAEEMFDGKWVIMTNNQSISNIQAGIYYQTLQNIERGFRDLKSLITVQPIFHWKEDRIRAHIFVCFLSLIVKWYICKTLDKDSQKVGRRFIEQMIDLKAIEVDKQQKLYVRTEINQQTSQHLVKLGLPRPSKVLMDKRNKRPSKSQAHPGGRPKSVTNTNLNQLSLIPDTF